LNSTAAENGIEIKVILYESGEQILFMLSDHPNDVDIIYLDILMGKMNGIETAKRLREIGCLAQIIFLTTSDEYVFEAFDVSPFYYIVKDEMPTRKFKDVFLKAKESVRLKESDYIIITSSGTKEKIRLDLVLYFEVKNRIITAHLKSSEVDYYSKLEDVERTLTGKDFIRIHRSYLVNCFYIEKLSRSSLTLTDGTVLPVSEKYSEKVQKSFSMYLLK
jgi:DNA-binding LytR/AlgR family response regulator